MNQNSNGLTGELGLALVDGLLSSNALNMKERSTLIVLMDELNDPATEGNPADFFDDFFESDVAARLVFRGLEGYIAFWKKRKGAR